MSGASGGLLARSIEEQLARAGLSRVFAFLRLAYRLQPQP